MAYKPDITINGKKLPAHQAWIVQQAVVLLSEQTKNFVKLGVDAAAMNDCVWMLDNVMEAMAEPNIDHSAAG